MKIAMEEHHVGALGEDHQKPDSVFRSPHPVLHFWPEQAAVLERQTAAAANTGPRPIFAPDLRPGGSAGSADTAQSHCVGS